MTGEERQELRRLIDAAKRERAEAQPTTTCERCSAEFGPPPQANGVVKRFCSRRCQKYTADQKRRRRLMATDPEFRARQAARKRRYEAAKRARHATPAKAAA